MPPPYGGPPMGPPGPGGAGGRKNNGAVVAIAVLVVAAVGGGLFFALSGGGDDGGVSDDGKTYTLTTPEQIGDLSLSFPLDSALTDTDAAGLGVAHQGRAGGIYMTEQPVAEPVVSSAMFSGLHGTVEDPERAVDDFFASGAGDFTEDGTTQLTGSPESFSPEGFENGVMKCQMLQAQDAGPEQTSLAPLCAWADYDTFAFVLSDRYTEGLGQQDPEPVSLEAGADFTAAVRNAVRVEGPGGEGGGTDGGGGNEEDSVQLPWEQETGGQDGGATGGSELPSIPPPQFDSGGGDSGEVYGDIEIPMPDSEVGGGF